MHSRSWLLSAVLFNYAHMPACRLAAGLPGQYLALAGDIRAVVLKNGRERKPFNTCRACKAVKPYGYGGMCTACTANGCTSCK